jgi:serine protease Do
VIFTEDGYVLTNHHVVAGGTECMVWFSDGSGYSAKYVAGDAENDLAILKVDGAGLPAVEFGDSEALEVGDPAYAIGNPLGVELQGTLTDGIISAINRDVQIDGRTMTLLQTNAALNIGNSGGPLINQYGQVVGVNVIKIRSDYASAEGLGFAIPSSFIERMANDLLTYGELKPEPLLGISVMNSGTQLEEKLWGAEVDSVVEGGAGDLAGIRKGDFIISAGGQTVIDSGDVLEVRRRYYVGDEMPMKLWRNGEIIEVILKLDKAVE